MSVKLRTDFDASMLRSMARQSRDASQARRLLALALVYDGKSRTEAANTGGVGLQILRDWVVRFNADGPEGLKDRWHKGPEPKLNDEQRSKLIQMIEDGPFLRSTASSAGESSTWWAGFSMNMACLYPRAA